MREADLDWGMGALSRQLDGKRRGARAAKDALPSDVRHSSFGISQIIPSRVVIAVVVGEVAGCDLQTNAMARLKTAGRWAELDAQFHHRPQFQQLFTIEAVAVTRTHHAVAHLPRGSLIPICGRVLIHQACKEIRIWR